MKKGERKMHITYAVYATCKGKPAGFMGRFRTKEEAREEAERSRKTLSARVIRECIPDEWYEEWESAGFKPKGWRK